MLIEGLQAVTQGLSAYFITHACYGAFEHIYPNMLKAPVDNFDLEMSNSELDMLDLFRQHRFTKDISFGVADSHSHEVEDVATVRRRVEQAPDRPAQRAGLARPRLRPQDPQRGRIHRQAARHRRSRQVLAFVRVFLGGTAIRPPG